MNGVRSRRFIVGKYTCTAEFVTVRDQLLLVYSLRRLDESIDESLFLVILSTETMSNK